MKEILTIEEVAELLNTTPAAVRMRVYRGQLKARKLGRRFFFIKEELFECFKPVGEPNTKNMITTK